MTYLAFRLQHARGESVALRHLIGRRHQPTDTDQIYTDWHTHDRQLRAARTKAER